MAKVEATQTWVPLEGGRLALGHRPKKTSFGDLREQGCTALLTLLSEREGASARQEAACSFTARQVFTEPAWWPTAC